MTIANGMDFCDDPMNVSLMMTQNHVVRCGPQLEIYHGREIKTVNDYDCVIWMVMNYLNLEGFLDKQTCAIENTFVFDCSGTQVTREELANNEAL